MPITVLVRSTTAGEARLTFDGVQRVVIGRGSSCDVRIPEGSVSHRHASLQLRGADFVIIDEGSTNGTFVGGVRVAPRTSRIVKSGDMVRLGRVWIELRVDQMPATRDLALATRDLALALVADALAAAGADPTMRVRVVEGPDQGATFALAEEGRSYVFGRGPSCDLLLADEDASREHAHVVRRGNVVTVRDLGAKNGTWVGPTRVPGDAETVWRPSFVMQLGRSVIALEEPLADALARIEGAADEPMRQDVPVEAPPPPPIVVVPTPASPLLARATPGAVHSVPSGPPSEPLPPPLERPRRAGWSIADWLVMAAAMTVLAFSIFLLAWLLGS